MTELLRPAAMELLTGGTLEPLGQIREASNATLLCDVELDGQAARCVYKPVRGEQPLWDFPDGTLAGREVGSYLISEAMGLQLIPPTVMRDGPYGPGMAQLWVEPDTTEADDHRLEPVDLCAPDAVPDGWMPVLSARGPDGGPLVLVHSDDPALRRLALLDLVINNADRKGGHILTGPGGELFGVDHGICLHSEDKLRTVLWGWADQELVDDELLAVEKVSGALAGELADELSDLITAHEIDALAERLRKLLDHPVFPTPHRPRPIPWPPF
ncbi:SCO1664 family protein [Jongsikchunia kroppenstedtii]|uniref:SCO1664 family protein n=1 Tax=Jongsikchunia kroppenstedtii TaxID=1121721 RepID=UPI00037BB8C9|nr:SCO1664 family protein [Jongsikchunia kroppenstedtii]